MKPVRIMIMAGEISGDLHAAPLVRELRALCPAPVEIYGIGGDRLKAEGVEIYEHCSRTGVMGFWEVFKRGRFFLRLLRQMTRLLDERRPDILLTVDFVSFNMRLAKQAKQRGIPVVHYVCPQVWAWKKGRIPEYARLMDRLLVMFPFEVNLWKGTGLDVIFVGHPLIDRAEEARKDTTTVLPWEKEGVQEFRSSGVQNGNLSDGIHHSELLDSRTPELLTGRVKPCRIALFPGSRRTEVGRHLPVMMEAALLIEQRLGACHFVIPVPTEAVEHQIAELLADIRLPHTVSVVQTDSRVVLRDADAAIVKSGTSTLEAALMGCPQVIVYQMAKVSAWFIRRVIQVPFVGLPNIVAGREVCRELLQRDCTPKRVAEETLRLVEDTAERDQMKRDMAEVTALLGGGGASRRAARAIFELIR